MKKLFNLQHLVLAALLTWCAQVAAQSPDFAYTNQLLDVTFVNTAFPTGIAKDDGSGYFTAPDWSSRGRNPVAYVSGMKLKVKARFKFTCKPTGKVYVQGVNGEGYTLPPLAVTFTSDTEGYYEGETKVAFPVNVVNAFDKFAISWQMSTDVNLPYKEFANSANPLYVLYASSIGVGTVAVNAEGTTYPLLTTIHLACTNAKGISDVSKIVNAIYLEFQDRKVRKVNGTQDMSYWAGRNPLTANTVCRTVSGLLTFEDATCGTWATFFNDMLLLNGIAGSKIGVVTVLGTTDISQQSRNNLIDDVSRNFSLAAVRDFTIYPYGRLANAMFYVKKWLITADRSFSDCTLENVGSLKLYRCSNDLDGVPSQSNPNPRAYFENHAIIVFNNTIYDPSYGPPPQSQSDWIKNSIDATGAIIAFPVANAVSYKAWFESRNTSNIRIN